MNTIIGLHTSGKTLGSDFGIVPICYPRLTHIFNKTNLNYDEVDLFVKFPDPCSRLNACVNEATQIFNIVP